MTNLENKILEEAKDYLVDTSASLGFYTPLMVVSEYFVAGMESEEVMKSRISAAGIHLLVMRPYGRFRHWWAKKWNANKESSKLKKTIVDSSASMLYQIPLYSTLLYFSGASFEETSVALPSGLAVGLFFGRPYGYCLDKWRNIWKRKETL